MTHALAGLRRVRFVDDDGEALARDGAHLFGDDREFLQGGGDDLLARFQRLLELLRTFGNRLDHAGGLFEGDDGVAQLPVENAAIGDDHH